MARLLPNTFVGDSMLASQALVQLMAALDDTYELWQRMPEHYDFVPDFIAMKERRQVCFIYVPEITEIDLGNEVFLTRSFEDFRNRLKPFMQFLTRHQIDALQSDVNLMSLFPAINERYQKKMAFWPGAMLGTELDLNMMVEQSLSEAMTTESLERLQRSLSPGTVVPKVMTVRTQEQESLFDDYVLDYNQELASKIVMSPTAQEEGVSRDFSLQLVNGVAGSGKSLVLLYRLRRIYQNWPNKQVLFLTHNTLLLDELKKRARVLGMQDAKINWSSFSKWCLSLLNGKKFSAISTPERKALIQEVWEAFFQKTKITPHMLEEEIGFYKDRLLFSRQEYLDVERKGRGFRLSQKMRHLVYNAIEAFDQRLKDRQLSEWSDLPRMVWDLYSKKPMRQYDFILIDEAQFFAPIWFELVKKSLAEHNGHLSLAADPAQGFLKRGQTWSAAGLDVVGHTVKLTKCYRNTQAIMTLAKTFLDLRLGEVQGALKPELDEMQPGVVPQLCVYTTPRELTAVIVELLMKTLEEGGRIDDILVLTVSNSLKDDVAGLFQAQSFATPFQGLKPRIANIQSATGLESPIVVIAEVDRLFHFEQVAVEDVEKIALGEKVTKLLYMGMTRAGQRLLLFSRGAPNPELEYALQQARKTYPDP